MAWWIRRRYALPAFPPMCTPTQAVLLLGVDGGDRGAWISLFDCATSVIVS